LKSQTNAAVDCLFAFTGRPFDKRIGLQNNLNRWYDAKIGGWVTHDPLGMTKCEVNTVSYCHNSPTSHVDPSGTSFSSFFENLGKGILVGIGAAIIVIGVAVAIPLVAGAVAGGIASALGAGLWGTVAAMMTASGIAATITTWGLFLFGAAGAISMGYNLLYEASDPTMSWETWFDHFAYDAGILIGSWGVGKYGGGRYLANQLSPEGAGPNAPFNTNDWNKHVFPVDGNGSAVIRYFKGWPIAMALGPTQEGAALSVVGLSAAQKPHNPFNPSPAPH
jgi:RHS repeat-associated protein